MHRGHKHSPDYVHHPRKSDRPEHILKLKSAQLRRIAKRRLLKELEGGLNGTEEASSGS
jgi:hypothetical protein